MLSMTGYGSGEAEAGGLAVTCEIRSVNHRFLDVALRLPGALAFLENDIRAVLKERVARGRLSVSYQLGPRSGGPAAMLDRERLDQAIALLRHAGERLQAATGRAQELGLEHLLAVPELFEGGEAATAPEELRGAGLAALAQAVDGLVAMKVREGRELAAEMRGRLDRLRQLLDVVTQQAPRAAGEALERLRARLAQLVAEEIDPQRLAQEAAMLADRANINEECERLGIHIESFRGALDEGGQVAKRLNFLLQEMHREVNTMGSKTNLMEITQHVIAMKEEVESMREQVQNLE
ncbi:MAG: YicC/YloC family endoribonuclease [Candidatus Krumholzibacteriia bacterium]